MSLPSTAPLRIGQFSAYYGDRGSAITELLASDCDVLTGDYLAELTMLVLRKNQMRGGVGYAEGFLNQLRGDLSEIARRGVKVVANAGGLEPEACAERVRALCAELGVELTVAAVTGDDQLARVEDLRREGQAFAHLEDGRPLDLSDCTVLTANAYLGAWPIVEALRRGADIVVCPRVTDAALVIGAAAWHFDWANADYDRLAGALLAGHVVECGCQATGGNYAWFDRHDDLGLPGMPIAEIEADGSAIITKSAGSGGVVDVGTVTAQLVYEIGGPLYHNPDVIADVRSVRLTDVGPDRVRLSGAHGLPPTPDLKLSLSYEGGYRNQVTVGLTGGRIEQKEGWLRRQVADAVGPPESFQSFRWTRIGPTTTGTGSYDEETALVVISARDRDRGRVSRSAFSDRITQLGTSSIPGFYTFTPPAKERLVGVQWPCLIPKAEVCPRVVLGEEVIDVAWPVTVQETAPEPVPVDPPSDLWADQPTTSQRLDTIVGTRSGDKAGMANVGIWTETDEQYDWLSGYLSVDRFRELVPESAGLTVERHELPNVRALNFCVHGWLEDGVASCTRVDAQAKGLGEYLGSRRAPIPTKLSAAAGADQDQV